MIEIRGWVRRWPWWVTVGLGAVCVALGVLLIGRPFRSLTVLVWWTAAGLLFAGVSELLALRASRRWSTRVGGVLLVAAAVVLVSWPHITIFGLAIAAGVALVLRGLLRVVEGWSERGFDRWIDWMVGVAYIGLGVVALSWPTATVLVLAVVFGVAVTIAGVRTIAAGLRAYRNPDGTHDSATGWPTAVRLVGAVVVLALAAGAVAISVAVRRAGPSEPDAFYTAPSPLPDLPPGSVLRSEEISNFTPDATTWRVLYMSTGFDGAPAAVSGLVVVPDAPAPAGGRKIIGYTHGTVGVASRCAPSAQGLEWGDFMRSEGIAAFVDAGYVVAATDYQGLGTRGPHPYLVGTAEGMDELDMIRAAQQIPGADASNDVALWGHSQGGHASLFTAQLSASYAPELNVVGVAAGAPAPDVVALFEQNIDSPVGKILISMALAAWADVYDAATLDQILTVTARPIVRKLARTCLYSELEVVGAFPASLTLGISFLSNPPWTTEPWKGFIATNNPGRVTLGVPVLLTQGAADEIVPPAVTEALLQRLCENGDPVELRLLDGIGHLDGGPAAVPDVTKWIAARFAGGPMPTNDCPTGSG
ncbi:MAG TPA: lipase family protein [Ilumatobacteraceae bacterium]|nr:lipase family protein [Ilumatobacteraceae bacterium]